MRSRYDPREDRILLVLAPPSGERKFWVTRKLWLALYHHVAVLTPATPEDAAASPPQPQKPKAISPEDSQGAVRLESVKMNKGEQDTTIIVFQAGAASVPMTFRAPGLARFRHMLETQADRAGWDVPAAMERIRAEAAAGAAVRRAST